LGLLTRREHSRRELERKLAARGISCEETTAAVARMAAEGWQDDGRFAEYLARSRAANGQGPVRIRAELMSHGLGEDAVARAFQALSEAGEDDWLEKARALAGRRYGSDCADDPAVRRKAADFLIRRGFDAATARTAAGFDSVA
jgi:regulatory protein